MQKLNNNSFYDERCTEIRNSIPALQYGVIHFFFAFSYLLSDLNLDWIIYDMLRQKLLW